MPTLGTDAGTAPHLAGITMSLLNPFAGLRHLGKVPRFLADLVADLRFLFEPDLSPTGKRPPREWFGDEAAYQAAVHKLKREHQFRVVRQAVRKQLIRRSLWNRFGICYRLLGPLVMLCGVAVTLLHLMAIGSRPEILDFPWGFIGLAAASLIVTARLLLGR
jgi:hypothetical protein